MPPRRLWTAAQGDLCEIAESCVVYSSPTTPQNCNRSKFDCGSCLDVPGFNKSVVCNSKFTQDSCLGTWCPAREDLPPFPFPFTTTQRPTTTPVPVTTTMRPPPSTTPTPIVTSKLPMTTALPIDTINSDTSIYIGVSCGVLLLIVFSLFILWKRRQHRAELQEIETLRKEKEQEEMLHGDPVLFNTIGHQSLIASARSEPDAMWWASHAEKDDAQPPSTNQGATRLATSISSKSGIAEVPV